MNINMVWIYLFYWDNPFGLGIFLIMLGFSAWLISLAVDNVAQAILRKNYYGLRMKKEFDDRTEEV